VALTQNKVLGPGIAFGAYNCTGLKVQPILVGYKWLRWIN